MNKELYNELRKIEDRLYDIAKKESVVEFDRELYEALYESWISLYSYLEKVNHINL